MTCPACPITVKTALSRVGGVEKIDVAFEQREVVVRFDDSKTSPRRLTQATLNAGYPSTIKP
jgi:mercuric ion binding protein